MPYIGAAFEFLRKRFGGPVHEVENTITVGTAALSVAPSDGERLSLIFVNLGATTIYVAPSPQVSSTRGLRLGATGGTVSMTIREDASLPAAGWWAVGSGAGGTLYVLESKRLRAEKEPGGE